MPRPSGLVSLFWGNATGISATKIDASTDMDCSYCEAECQTDSDDNVCVSCQTSFDNDAEWNHEVC